MYERILIGLAAVTLAAVYLAFSFAGLFCFIEATGYLAWAGLAGYFLFGNLGLDFIKYFKTAINGKNN